MYKGRIVLGGLASVCFLGTFAAGPAFAATASAHQVPVVGQTAGLGAGTPTAPDLTGLLPAVGSGTGALLNGLGTVTSDVSGELLPAVGPAVNGLAAPVDGIVQATGNLAGVPVIGAIVAGIPALQDTGALLDTVNGLVNGATGKVTGK